MFKVFIVETPVKSGSQKVMDGCHCGFRILLVDARDEGDHQAEDRGLLHLVG